CKNQKGKLVILASACPKPRSSGSESALTELKGSKIRADSRPLRGRNILGQALPRVLFVLWLAPNVPFPAELPAEIPLWPNGAPGSEGQTAKEVVTKSASGEISVWSIHRPSITPYLPSQEKATGTAMLVIPGGGHRVLAITHEGYNVAEWLS